MKDDLKSNAIYNSYQELPVKDEVYPNLSGFIQVVSEHISADNQDGLQARFLCIDGPSGSGKNTLINSIENCKYGQQLSVLDTNVFMRPRLDRNDKERESLFKNWYRVDSFKLSLLEFLDPKKNIIIEKAYKHDMGGDISHIVTISPGLHRVLLGRYSLHPEVQSVFESQLVAPKKIIIDAPQHLRLKRVKQRAFIQKNRDPEEQEMLLIDTVDPDWYRYFPLIFKTADWYVVNYSDSDTTYCKPEDCIDNSHDWGAYANLHVQPERIFRLIEIGKNGATSLHMHENLNEFYYHALGGPLGVSLRSNNIEREYILYPGNSIMIPNRVYHKAYAVDNTPPVYYETVLPINGMHIDNNDIHRLKKATPMSGTLAYL